MNSIMNNLQNEIIVPLRSCLNEGFLNNFVKMFS